MNPIHERTALLIGADGLEFLAKKHVFIAGLGGVGSYAAEAVARAGIGRITLLDHDVVGPSNMNRQLVALHSTLGRFKSEVMAERIHDINPALSVEISSDFLTIDNVGRVVPADTDYALDCIDSIACKAALVHNCQQRSIPVASSMGAGGRLDPAALRVGPLVRTVLCPLARELRKRLRRLSANLDYPVVYSTEQPVKGTEHRPLEGPTPGRPRAVNGTISYLPALFGYTLAGLVIRTLLMERTAIGTRNGISRSVGHEPQPGG